MQNWKQLPSLNSKKGFPIKILCENKLINKLTLTGCDFYRKFIVPLIQCEFMMSVENSHETPVYDNQGAKFLVHSLFKFFG